MLCGREFQDILSVKLVDGVPKHLCISAVHTNDFAIAMNYYSVKRRITQTLVTLLAFTQGFLCALTLGYVLKTPLVINLGAVFVAEDRKSTRLNSSHVEISYAVICL